MKPEAMFINGQYEEVLENILSIQSELPDQILYMQPYSGFAMRKLKATPPSVDKPMKLFLSTTKDLASVWYEAEIVGWADKRSLSTTQREVINRVINALQPGQEGLYDAANGGKGESVNLLFIRRMQKRSTPFSVSQLTKTSDDQPLSENRTQAGGWSYVVLNDA